MSGTNNCQQYESDRTLFFEALRQKIRQAEECLYRLGFKMAVPKIRQNGATLSEAEDVFQESIIAFHLRLHTFTADAKPTSILYTIVRNKWIDMCRNKKDFVDITDDFPIAATEPCEDEKLLEDQMQEQLRVAIGQLTPESQRIVQLLIYEKMKPDDVAQALNTTRASVDNQKYRIIKYLREKLKGGKQS